MLIESKLCAVLSTGILVKNIERHIVSISSFEARFSLIEGISALNVNKV